MSFNDQPALTGKTLTLRGLTAVDFEGLAKAASDPVTWAGHPATERYKPEVFRPYFDFLLEAGGTLLILDRKTGEAIGCSRYYTGPDAPEDIGIGFTFLSNTYWGGGTNFELKTLMLGHAFEHFERVWFHIAPTNIRSQKATAKLGAVFVDNAELELAGIPAPWTRFRLDREVWRDKLAARQAG